MKKISQFNKNMVIYMVDKGEVLVDKNIKSNVFEEEVIINHYTVENNYLKKIFNGNHDILIREELDRNGNTLLVETFMTEDKYKSGDFEVICSLLAKRILKMVN